MKLIPFVLNGIITTGLIILCNSSLTIHGNQTPRLGFFLSPQTGFWQNAIQPEIINESYHFSNLQGNAEVYFDERLVPHVYADNEYDLYFLQGFLHAKFRLWQMEFQVFAAGGRLSEILGDSANGTNFLAVDKYFRRLGLKYGAEQSLQNMMKNAQTKEALEAYTAGVNNYIENLKEADYPLEYKLLNYKPELWSPLKTALLLKYISYDLAGHTLDFEMSNAKSIFTKEQFEKLFPYGKDSTVPIFPKNTIFPIPSVGAAIPAIADSVYFNYKQAYFNNSLPIQPAPDNGSNNWVVSGSKTKSGRPILCNDPHLNLTLPSVWYEMQLSSPAYNVYGVCFPGSPSIIIGFNDNCAWGVTNSERDVMDFYEIQFKDSTQQEYLFNGSWHPTTFRNEIIKIKGKAVADTEKIAMTIWGPVTYDASFNSKLHNNKAYACRWTGHDATSNELKTFMHLNSMKNYADYLDAISTFFCPGQNFAFASKNGDIAIKQQGNFPAKWWRQGDFVMPGTDSSFAWTGMISNTETPVLLNPENGFVSSANQYPYDYKTYPYYMGGRYEIYRGITINRKLAAMQNITVEDMQHLQTDNYNVFAEMAKPVLLHYIHEKALTDEDKHYLTIFKQWNLYNDVSQAGASVFTAWWDSLMHCMYDDEFSQTKLPMPSVEHSTLLESLLKDTLYEFADDITTPQKETIGDMVTKAFRETIPVLRNAEKNNELAWGIFKKSSIMHLLKIPSLSHLKVIAGGGVHIINAYHDSHGPSWRMIVHMTDTPEAYVIFPGGESGNPASAFYDNAINDWVAGKYYKVKLMSKQEMEKNARMGKILFTKN